MKHAKHTSPVRALFQFGIRQTIKGAIIVGLLSGLLIAAQGAGYAATYPDATSREQFAHSMKGAPALGILYGEMKNLVTSASYAAYRAVAVVGLITAIWGLTTSTRLLRGQEEDGQWETITSGNTTTRRASLLILTGFIFSITITFVIMTLMTAVTGMLPNVAMSLGTSALLVLAILLPSLLFTAVGFLVSQLSFSRRRALMYGVAPLLLFFALRSVGNVINDLYFLKNFTPFGWTDMLSPVIDPKVIWIIPFVVAIPIIAGLATYLAGKRDLSAALLPEPTHVKSHFSLLGSAIGLMLRQNTVTFIMWAASIVAMSVIIATVSNVASEALADSPSLSKVVSQLGKSATQDPEIAFIGAGMVFIVIAMLIMSAVNLAAIRRDEARGYLDNLLTQPIRRSSWLILRLFVITVSFTITALLAVCATWLIASNQGLTIELGNFLLVGLALTGTVIFTLGLGTMLYGLWPRVAAISMYVVLGWSFLIDLIGSVVKLDDIVIRSSLFHYMSLSPVKAPDWTTFSWLLGLGLVMATIGVITFTKRDIVAE